MIKIENLTKIFSNKKAATFALQNINLTIKSNTTISLTGPSGSGKSTLLNLIAGFETATEGDIFIKKQALSKLSDEKLSQYRNRQIGFVFQEFRLIPHLSVLENVLLPTHFGSKSRRPGKLAKKLIDEVGLTNKAHEKVRNLSGGQKQRTAIARALINSPKIILADEPTGNLDEQTGKQIIKLLKQISKKHKALLIIATHDPKVSKIADQIIHLKNGKARA